MAQLPAEPTAATPRELPAEEEYYRPQRAAELRRKARRLERLQGVTGAAIVGAGSLAGVAGVGFVSFYLRLPVFLLIGMFFLVGLTFWLVRLRDRLPDQVRLLREQAAVLEAEHHVHALAPRGTLPKSQSNP